MTAGTVRRGRLVDAALAGAVLVAAQVAIAGGREAGAVPRDWLAYLLGVAMAAPVLLRRRAPLVELYLVAAALLAFYSLRYPGFPPAVVLAVPLFDAAGAGHPWRALPVPVFFLSAGVIVASRQEMSAPEIADVFLTQAALAAVAVLLGALVRSRRAYTEEVQRHLRAVEAERERDAEGRVARERLRIARELHDTVAHAISTITVQSGSALYLLDSEPSKAREALVAIRRTGKEALAEMRAALRVLRGAGEPDVAVERDAGLDRLPQLLTAVRAAGVDVTLDDGVGKTTLPPQVDHAVYRILQESLTNVLRHAGQNAAVRIRLGLVDGVLEVVVEDDGTDGTGAPASAGGGHGLIGMAERAQALGGRVEWGALAGGGFAVRARLPLAGGSA